jgi:hypothetical protein
MYILNLNKKETFLSALSRKFNLLFKMLKFLLGKFF